MEIISDYPARSDIDWVKQNITKRTANLLIAGLSLLVACGFLILWLLVWSRPALKVDQGINAEMMYMPHGRILNVVIEADGAYIGEEFIPLILLEKYFKEHRADLGANYVIVFGTESARYGSAVQAYDLARSILKLPSTIEPRVLPNGTRLEAIEVRKRGW